MTSARTLLVATWADGLFAFGDGALAHELRGQSVTGLTHDPSGGVLAIVDARTVCRRSAEGR